MSNVATLVEQIAGLSKPEFDKLLEHIKALRGGALTTKATEETNSAADDTYRAFSDAMHKVRGIRPAPARIMRKRKAWADFSEASEQFREYIKSLEKERVRQLAVEKWLCALIVHKLIQYEMHLSINSFTWGMINANGIVESSFPGYVQSGYIHVILSQLYKGTTRKLEFPS